MYRGRREPAADLETRAPRLGQAWPVSPIVWSSPMLKASVSELRELLPRPASARWPEGEHFIEAFTHGSLVVELYAPRDRDTQSPHDRDEVYFVVSGSGEFVVDGRRSEFVAGDALFVAAGVEHRF